MGEKPILFSTKLVRAILDVRKTETRRVVKPQPVGEIRRCPYGVPGDRLWVRETFYCDHCDYPNAPVDEMRLLLEYRADHRCRDWEAGCPCSDDQGRGSWRPSIHMPRWASRITLEVTGVRVERLQAITEEGAKAEGVKVPMIVERIREQPTHVTTFRDLWDSINGKRPGCDWASSPWVWVVQFKRVQP